MNQMTKLYQSVVTGVGASLPKTIVTNKDLTISEIENLEPYVQIVSSTSSWTALRMMISSMEFTGNPGRNIKFFVKDKNTNSFLGVLSVGSDVTSLGVRDKYIGWTKENKFEHGRLNHTCIGCNNQFYLVPRMFLNVSQHKYAL